MAHLTLRVPDQAFLSEPYQLTENVLLRPAQRIQLHAGNGIAFFLCSFFYVEAEPTRDRGFPSEWPFAPSYENLRDFVTFWSFLHDSDWVIRAFEGSESSPLFGEAPTEEPSEWNNGIQVLDPYNVRIRSGLQYSADTFELKDLYSRFLEADTDLRDLISLEKFEPNRYVADSRRVAYDNHLMRSSLDWIILDALSPAERCTANIVCPKCGKSVTSSHVNRSFRQRMEEDLLKNFPDAAEYAKILNAYKECRSDFFHSGRREDLPTIEYPMKDPVTREGRRNVSINDTIKMFRKEGLATQNAAILLHDIIHCILLNRLIPELALWPRFESLKLASFG